jgi:hypothetical protein
VAEPSVHDFVIARLTEQLPPKKHWWSRSSPERRAILRRIRFADYSWNPPAHSTASTSAAIHVLKLMARNFADHPDYNPVWDSNEPYVA